MGHFDSQVSSTKIVRLIVKKSFQAPLPPISVLGASLKGFGQVQTCFTTSIWWQRGENWVVSRIFAPYCLSFIFFFILDLEKFSLFFKLSTQFSITRMHPAFTTQSLTFTLKTCLALSKEAYKNNPNTYPVCRKRRLKGLTLHL